MRAVERIRGYINAFGSSKRHRGDLTGWLGRRPQLLAATGVYESALLFSNRLDPKLKELAELKAAGLVSCEFCLDIGSALARGAGVTERQMRDLPNFRDSDAYSALEKTVLAFAEAMTVTPAVGDDLADLRNQLARELSKGQIAELAATVAWENQRARLNQSLGVRPTGMSDGAACAVPETRR
ncbi:carboxymuconolactone decarboxylase family protein [Gordonia sp. SID5947]|uniref:carboxymuconolactone decarboxylase family protein n=1 Tax=Gordonia sp. SID5947 TaxID=2690315 RepID=UPI00137020F0|nr:carboxymuconolactone decarboxylase family protein [Gordonia sp. SID5947]MYR08412.1 carboxymuconolactone decarboxylase family protein [Gordonia sp. SID5947]